MEINPEHPVTKAASDHWHTLCLLIMRKMGKEEIVITQSDFNGIEPNSLAITIQELGDGLHIKILPMADALELAAKELRKQQEAASAVIQMSKMQRNN